MTAELFPPREGMHPSEVEPGTPITFVVPAHCVVREKDSAFVMQKGWPADAWRHFGPEIALDAGYVVKRENRNGVYGFKVVHECVPFGNEKRDGLGLFQTRYHWDDDHDPELIKASATELAKYMKRNRREHIRLGFPGIGAGSLKAEDVLALLGDTPLQHWKSRITLVFRTGDAAAAGGAP